MDLCTEVREKSEARVAIVIIMDGKHGSGFSCQGDASALNALPHLLNFLAKQIKEDVKEDLQ